MAKYEIKDGVGIIPEGTTVVEAKAFADCEELKNVVIPDSVTRIGYAAFAYCGGLTNIIIPDSVTEIGQEVFYSCKGLDTVTIGSSVREIGDGVFKDCDSLKQIIFRIADPALIEIERGVELGGYQAILCVPEKKSIAAFKKKAIWKKYAGIEVFDTAGDDLSVADKERENADKALLEMVGMKDCGLQLAPIPADCKPEEMLTVVYNVDESELPFTAVIDEGEKNVGCMLIDDKAPQNFKAKISFKKAGRHIVRLFPLVVFKSTFLLNGFPGSELIKYPDSRDKIDGVDFFAHSKFVPKKLLLGAGFNSYIPDDCIKYIQEIAVVPNNPYMEMQNGDIIRKIDKKVINK